jgi:hypothetical protein
MDMLHAEQRLPVGATEYGFRHVCEFALPGFTYRPAPYGGLGFRYRRVVDVVRMHDAFAERVHGAVGRSYLPIYRMADGEFNFIVGERLLIDDANQISRLKRSARIWFRRISGQTATYWGEAYGAANRQRALDRFEQTLRRVAGAGLIAPYFGVRSDGWGNAYFPPVCAWFDEHRIELTHDNYVPFYSVYALLSGPGRRELYGGRRILVVTHVTDSRQAAMTAGLLEEGAAAVDFLPISATQALLEDLDLSRVERAPDLVLVAAGVGSVSVLDQLQPLGVPGIDCGIALECYIDSSRRLERPFLVGDDRRAAGSIIRTHF